MRFYRVVTPKIQRIVFADISSELKTLHNLIESCVFIGAISFVIFLGISILLAHWTVRPVDRAWRQQRQFVADASHELKTPLTVIMTNAELLQSTDYDTESRTRFAGNILTMSQQMRSLVEGLLDLARFDNGQRHMAFSRQDFSKLVSDAVLPFEPVFYEKGLRLSTEVEDGIALYGSAQHLRQLVEILLDNAQKYSAEQGETKVQLRKQGRNHCLLAISNPGTELTKADLKNIFKRFYRVDQARSRTGSFGLGLSIAQSITQEHRGKIWAESVGGRNIFYVQLPVI